MNELNGLAPFAWPLTAVLLGILFFRPLKGLLASVASKDTIKISGVEFSASDLQEVIRQRELLKIGIIIATSDRKYNRKEMDFLKTRAVNVGGDPGNLSSETRRRIIDMAIEMASSDDEFTDEEYREIVLRGKEYEVAPDEVDDKILSFCSALGVEPPATLLEKKNFAAAG